LREEEAIDIRNNECDGDGKRQSDRYGIPDLFRERLLDQFLILRREFGKCESRSDELEGVLYVIGECAGESIDGKRGGSEKMEKR
jgi:hypothetical protein